MAKNGGRNMLKQQLINKNIVQQVGVKYYIYIYKTYLVGIGSITQVDGVLSEGKADAKEQITI
jgi:hypothetical protein